MISKKYIHLTLIFVAATAYLLSSCAPQPAAESPAVTAAATPIPQKETLKIWNPDAPTTLNPYFSLASQDYEPSRITYEPLADFDKDGNLVPILASEIPTWENKDLAEDNTYVIWKLREDVFWSDGEPFTADDVVFTYLFIIDPDVNVASKSEYDQILNVEALDEYTVKVQFNAPNPAWALPFVGIRGLILPKHIFEPYKGPKASEARVNTVPVGTGPYRVKPPESADESGIKPQEVLLLGSQVVKTTKIIFEPNPYYRFPDKIAFKQVIWRGGGYPDEYTKQLFVTGDLHIAYQVDAAQMLPESKGELLTTLLTGTRRILINFTDPNTPSASGELSSRDVSHPLFGDIRVRQALAYAIDRQALVENVYLNSVPAYALLVSPPQYHSLEELYKYDPAKANALLDEAGYLDANGDGFREKDGAKIKLRFQSFVDPDTQRAQELIKQNLKTIGIDVEIKPTESSVMFGDDTTHPDSIARFNADLLMFRTTSDSFDPTAFMIFWTCAQIPQKSNGWKGNNNERWCNPAYDALLEKTKTELNPQAREKMFIELNDMLIKDVAVVPLVWEQDVKGVSKRLNGLDPTPWDSLTWNIQDWYLEQP